MARVFRQQYAQRTPDGERVTRDSAKWYVEYRDAQGIRRRVPGYTDKSATQQLASELERSAAREQSGLVDRFAVHRKRPLVEHLADYEAALRHRGRAEQYVATLIPRIRKVLSGCAFVYWPDLSASKVQGYVAELQAGGLGIQSANYYLASMKQFCRWCVQDGRAPDSPLVHLSGDNVRTDRRHDRRALDADELRRLLESARTGPTRFGMTGPARAMLYQLAAESVLRAGELRSLAWDSFDLDADPPTVTVRAGYSKHRRDDALPLKPSTAQTLARWRDESGPVDREHPVFAMPEKTATMIRADLADAGIEYRDADGRVCDFHALRHSFVSALARGGVHPKVANSSPGIRRSPSRWIGIRTPSSANWPPDCKRCPTCRPVPTPSDYAPRGPPTAYRIAYRFPYRNPYRHGVRGQCYVVHWIALNRQVPRL